MEVAFSLWFFCKQRQLLFNLRYKGFMLVIKLAMA